MAFPIIVLCVKKLRIFFLFQKFHGTEIHLFALTWISQFDSCYLIIILNSVVLVWKEINKIKHWPFLFWFFEKIIFRTIWSKWFRWHLNPSNKRYDFCIINKVGMIGFNIEFWRRKNRFLKKKLFKKIQFLFSLCQPIRPSRLINI